MKTSSRLGLTAFLVLGGLFALHVHLNLGGWPRFLALLRPEARSRVAVRGDLIVGFLPVT